MYLAAVGEHMTRVAGEVCDGLIPHPLTTQRYLRERTLPLLEEGLAASGRTLDGFSISLQGLVVTGRTEEEMAAADLGVRRQIAFYGSTPAYHGVLELHGWGELGVELNRLSRSTDEDRWVRMGELIDDDVLGAFAVVAEPDALGPALVARFGGIVDRFTFYTPYEHRRGAAGARHRSAPISLTGDPATGCRVASASKPGVGCFACAFSSLSTRPYGCASAEPGPRRAFVLILPRPGSGSPIVVESRS